MNNSVQESTLRDYLNVVFRRKWVIITTFVSVMIFVIIGLELKTPLYKARVKLLISAEKQTSSPYYRDLSGYRQTQISLTQSEIVNSYPVLECAVKALNLHERPADYEKNFCSTIKKLALNLKEKLQRYDPLPAEEYESSIMQEALKSLRKNLEVEPIRDTDMFSIIVADYDPETAAKVANVVSRSYVIFDLEQQLAELQLKHGDKNQIVLQLKDNINTMAKNLSGVMLPNIEAIGPASVKIIEQARTPMLPAGRHKLLTVGIAFFMSIFLGAMIAFGFEYIDQTFKSPQEVERFFNAPLLGAIPRDITKKNGRIQDREKTILTHPTYHGLSEQLQLVMKEKNMKSVLITASTFLDGSSAITVNLCKHLSLDDRCKVLLIDANLRVPAIHKILKLSNERGLANVIEGTVPLSDAILNPCDNLFVLTAGETALNPVTLLDSQTLQDIIKKECGEYKMIIVDYPNMNYLKDVSIISSYMDGIVIVINEGKTKRPVIKTQVSRVETLKTNVIGAILNNRTFAIPDVIYRRI
ncbi:MAG: polysaccharide biosynthesis tyrosine autokinase [Candidatus Kuenenia stuttgartiensis]|nr:polysaccharide biosynthesis tyrosine autokinase [Candidatus Kuenenia stuttgartiensis]